MWFYNPEERPEMDEVEKLREVVREAHEAIKDLRGLLREAKEERAVMLETLKDGIDDEIEAALTRGLEELTKAVADANEDATDRVFKKFDTIYDTLMGLDWESRKEGKRSIPDLLAEATNNPPAPSFGFRVERVRGE